MRTLFVILLALTAIAAALIWNKSVQTGLTHIELHNKKELQAIFSNLEAQYRQPVLDQLNYDYLFMAFCFSGIAVLCCMARKRAAEITGMQKIIQQAQPGKIWIKVFTLLALLQILTWGLDVWENATLEKWIARKSVGEGYSLFRAIVLLKFVLAVTGFVSATVYLLATIKKHGLLADKIKTNDAQKEKMSKMAA